MKERIKMLVELFSGERFVFGVKSGLVTLNTWNEKVYKIKQDKPVTIFCNNRKCVYFEFSEVKKPKISNEDPLS